MEKEASRSTESHSSGKRRVSVLLLSGEEIHSYDTVIGTDNVHFILKESHTQRLALHTVGTDKADRLSFRGDGGGIDYEDTRTFIVRYVNKFLVTCHGLEVKSIVGSCAVGVLGKHGDLETIFRCTVRKLYHLDFLFITNK